MYARVRLRRRNVYARESQHFHSNAFAWARKRVCTRKPTRQLKRVRLGEETCMHEKAITSIQTRSPRVGERVYTSSPKARKRVCTRKPTSQFKRIRLGEETRMHEKANKPTRQLERVRLGKEMCMHEKANTSIQTPSLRRGNVYARESQHAR